MAEPKRISPQEVRQQMQAGSDLMLICAYESDEKYRENPLEGSIPYSEFQSRLDQIPKDRPLVFYCG